MSTSIFPSNNSWITPRADDVRLTSDNCKIFLNQKIDKINKVILNGSTASVKLYIKHDGTLPNEYKDCLFSSLSTTPDGKNLLTEVDITKFIVEEQEYKTLPVYKQDKNEVAFSNLCKNNTYFYLHNSNIINIVNAKYKNWFDDSADRYVTQTLLHSVVLYYLEHGELWHVFNNNTLKVIGLPPTTIDPGGTESPTTTQFRVYYTPLGESVKLQVPKTNPQPKQFCIPYSQQQPIVDNVTHGREMQSIANRAGCEKKEVVRTLRGANAAAGLRKNGVIWREKDESGNFTGNVWRLTGQRIQICSETFIRVVETWSKNWSYRSENVPIDREFRSWKIPADIVQRNLLRQDYCLTTVQRQRFFALVLTLGDILSIMIKLTKRKNDDYGAIR